LWNVSFADNKLNRSTYAVVFRNAIQILTWPILGIEYSRFITETSCPVVNKLNELISIDIAVANSGHGKREERHGVGEEVYEV